MHAAVISRLQRVNARGACGFPPSDYTFMQNYVQCLLLPLFRQVKSYFPIQMTVAVSTQVDGAVQ